MANDNILAGLTGALEGISSVYVPLAVNAIKSKQELELKDELAKRQMPRDIEQYRQEQAISGQQDIANIQAKMPIEHPTVSSFGGEIPEQLKGLSQYPLDEAVKISAIANKPKTMSLGMTWESADPELQSLAKAVVAGNVRSTDLGFRDRSVVMKLANEYANQQGIPFRSYEGNVKEKAAIDFATGKTAQKADSLNLSLTHADRALENFKKLENMKASLLNTPINRLREKTNDPNIIALGNDLNALRGELANVFKQSGATDQEIASWNKYLNEDLTPIQSKSALHEVQKLLSGRLSGIEYRQKNISSGSVNRKIISPESELIMNKLQNLSPENKNPLGIGKQGTKTMFNDPTKQARYEAWKQQQNIQ